MTAIAAELPRLGSAHDLQVARTDIDFFNVSPEQVSIEIKVWNRGEAPSPDTFARLMAAPLGAFVPWRPLEVVAVPALEPGEAFQIRTEAIRVAPAVLGPPDRVPPRRLLTALASDDDRPAPAALQRPARTQPAALRPAAGAAVLPADLFQLLTGRDTPHWAGNLNVFVGGRAVERHLARALRIYPGRVNMAFFVVGSGPDAYAFHLAGEGAAWDATLYDMTSHKSLALDMRGSAPLAQSQWIDVPGQRLMILALRPPQTCPRGTVEVHVEQRSTGRSAVVEFSLDPAAAGPGCYVV
jgi:hypothetical protein